MSKVTGWLKKNNMNGAELLQSNTVVDVCQLVSGPESWLLLIGLKDKIHPIF